LGPTKAPNSGKYPHFPDLAEKRQLLGIGSRAAPIALARHAICNSGRAKVRGKETNITMNKIVSLFAGVGLLAMGCASGADVAETESVAGEDAAVTGGSATLTYQSDYGTGYCANVTISNALSQSTARWQAVLDLKTNQVTNSWNVKFSGTTGRITAGPVDYNTNIQPGGTVSFGWCANASGPTVRPTLLAWNMETNVYATCSSNSGVNPTKAALAVAMGKDLGRWTPNTDLAISNGKVVLSSAGLAKCGSNCGNIKGILGQQDATFVDQGMFNATNYKEDLKSSFDRQTNLITNLTNNDRAHLPPAHKLTLVGGPTNLGSGSCGPHYIFQVDNADGTPLTSAQASNMGNALCFYGYGSCGNNTYLGFQPTGVNCPSGRTCIAIDPTDGDNGSTSTTSAGSAPTYPGNRVYDPANTLLNTACIHTNGKLLTLQSKCASTPNTCGYLYCM
jgi:hypothetical protein